MFFFRLQRLNCLVDVWIIRMCFISEHVLNLQPWPVTCKRHHDPICGQCSKAVSTHILSQKQSGRFVFVIHCHKGPRHSYFSPWPEKSRLSMGTAGHFCQIFCLWLELVYQDFGFELGHQQFTLTALEHEADRDSRGQVIKTSLRYFIFYIIFSKILIVLDILKYKYGLG